MFHLEENHLAKGEVSGYIINSTSFVFQQSQNKVKIASEDFTVVFEIHLRF